MGNEREPRPEPPPNSLSGGETNLEALRARQLAHEPGYETPGLTGPASEGVLIQICEICGKEYMYDSQEPPADLRCEKCGNQVFRSFFDTTKPDEVRADFQETTERDLATDAAEGEATRGDILDLNNP
jgi:DNA-directed RNA polymerase subunit RPC12/RpoP